MIRIAGGSARGRRLDVPKDRDVRPTLDRVRENLFNLLIRGAAVTGALGRDPVEDARVLDAFAGTGALGLEALSRGAAQATFMETDAPVRAILARNIRTLDRDGGRTRLLACDALHPPPARAPADLILLDPPHGRDLAVPALSALGRAGWIAPGALVAVERARRDPHPSIAGADRLDSRVYGRVAVDIFRLGPDFPAA